MFLVSNNGRYGFNWLCGECDMDISNNESETNIAVMLIDGDYSWTQAKRSIEVQGLSLDNVERIFGRLYEQEQCANEGYYHA